MDVEMIRGDTQPLKFQIKDNEGNILQMSAEDELIFTVKKNYNTKQTILQKKLSTNDITYKNGWYLFTLKHEDTANLKYGTYVYDIQLMSEGIVATLVLGTITLTQEVTHIENENRG